MKLEVDKSYVLVRKSDEKEILVDVTRRNSTLIYLTNRETEKSFKVTIAGFKKLYSVKGELVEGEEVPVGAIPADDETERAVNGELPASNADEEE